jgi:excisionase family DNA binding protein
METNVTLESLLREMITPIINQAVEEAIAKHFVLPTQPQPSGNDILTLEEAAVFLRVAKPTLYGMVHDQKISYSKGGKRLYFRKDDLVKYLTQHRHKSLDEIHKEANDYIAQKDKKY